MNKELIKQRFKRKLISYDENAKIQKQMAQKLIDIIALDKNLGEKEYINVLEIGCGTGLLTKITVDRLDYRNYYAIDIVDGCADYIKNINSDINFVVSDIEEYIKKDNKKYDLILSNASLQWIDNLSDFILELINKLNDEGTLVFSTFGAENFREIFYVMGKTLPYLSKQQLYEILQEYSPYIEEEIRVMAFKTPLDVLKHISSTGVNAISVENWTKKDLMNFEKEYNVFCANHPTLTYNPIYVMLNKTV